MLRRLLVLGQRGDRDKVGTRNIFPLERYLKSSILAPSCDHPWIDDPYSKIGCGQGGNHKRWYFSLGILRFYPRFQPQLRFCPDFFLLCVGGIRNLAFRILKIKEWLWSPKSLRERPRSETPGALGFFSVFQDSSFDQYPSSPAKLQNKLRIIQGVGSRSGWLISSTTKPQEWILFTQAILAWDSLGGFRRP
jgi:hypothetical protein